MITRLCTIHLFIYLVVALSQPKFGRGAVATVCWAMSSLLKFIWFVIYTHSENLLRFASDKYSS